MNDSRLKLHIIVSAVIGLFAATARADVALPVEYTPIDWVQSSGKEWIDTDVPARFGLRLDIDLMPCASVNDVCVCGAFDAANTTYGKYRLLLLHVFNGWFYRAGARYASKGSATANERVRIQTEILKGSQRMVIDDVQVDSSTVSSDYTSKGTANLFLFALNYGNSAVKYHSQTRIYSCKITDVENDNTVLRDFVPCRNANGVAGLWDKKSGTFFPPNGGALRGSDDVDTYITWVQTTATANTSVDNAGCYVDTGVPAKSGLVSDFDLVWLDTYNDRAVSGAIGNTKDTSKRFLPLHIYSSSGMQWGYRYGGTFTSSGVATSADRTKIHTEMFAGTQSLAVNGITKMTSAGGGTIDLGFNLFLFALNNVGTVNYCSSMRLYSCKMINAAAGIEREFRPVRMADGRIGLADAANDNKFYAINKKNVTDSKGKVTTAAEDFTYGGVYYTLDGTVIETHEGELTDDCLEGYSGIVHVGPYTLDATAVKTYATSLGVTGGRLSLKDDTATTVTVAGTLSLKGRAKVAIDLLPDGNDAFVVGGLDLASASAEEPVLLEVDGGGSVSMAAEDVRTIISGPTLALTDGDAEKFKVVGFAAQVAVRDRALVLVPVSVQTEDAVWTGAAGDGRWATAGNWEANAVPNLGVGVRFDLAAGGVTTCNLDNGFILRDILFGSAAGSFVHAGVEQLVVQAAISNESASAQYLPLPMALGVSGRPFEFATAGDLTLTGGVKGAVSPTLVKTGAGTLYLPDDTVAAATNIEVRSGTLKLDATGRASESAAGEIRIAAGARLDFNARVNNNLSAEARSLATHEKTVYVAGDGPDGQGAIVNSRLKVTNGYLGRLVLTGDASINGGLICCGSILGSTVTPRVEGPHALTILNDYATGAEYVSLNECSIELDRVNLRGCLQFATTLNGCITNGIHACQGGKLFLNATGIPATMPIVVDEGALELNVLGKAATCASAVTIPKGTELRVNVNTALSVLPLTLSGSVTNNGLLRAEQGKTLTLSGRLAGDGVLEGASVRFSGPDSCWAMEADDGGFTSKVDVTGVTDQALLAGLKNIDVIYTGATDAVKTFAIASAGDLTTAQALKIALRVTNAQGEPISDCWLECVDGQLVLHLCDRMSVRTAVWCGGASSDVGVAANWCCSNDVGRLDGAVPMAITKVILPANCVFNCTNGAPLTVKEVVLPETLGGDCDWRGLDAPLSGTVDLMGHALTVSRFDGAYTVTNSLEETTGELRIDVAIGNEENASVAICGNVKLVKEGAGSFAPARPNQSYTGGTLITGGTLGLGKYVYGLNYLGMTTGEVTVSTTNAVLDVTGKCINGYKVVLDGGTLRNNTKLSDTIAQLANVRLTADSKMEIAQDYGFIGNGYGSTTLDLAGHRLEVAIGNAMNFFAYNLTVTAGTLDITQGGFLRVNKGTLDASEATVVVNCALRLFSNMKVKDYVAKFGADWNEGSGALTVLGTFKPETGYYRGCQLQDGAHLDLSAWPNADVPFPLVSKFSSTPNAVSFASGATITVDLGGRHPANREQLVKWNVNPKSDGVRFRSSDSSIGLRALSDGLYCSKGMTIIFR